MTDKQHVMIKTGFITSTSKCMTKKVISGKKWTMQINKEKWFIILVTLHVTNYANVSRKIKL